AGRARRTVQAQAGRAAPRRPDSLGRSGRPPTPATSRGAAVRRARGTTAASSPVAPSVCGSRPARPSTTPDRSGPGGRRASLLRLLAQTAVVPGGFPFRAEDEPRETVRSGRVVGRVVGGKHGSAQVHRTQVEPERPVVEDQSRP